MLLSVLLSFPRAAADPGRIGFLTEPAAAEAADRRERAAARVVAVRPGSEAEAAGLRPDDRILGVDRRRLDEDSPDALVMGGLRRAREAGDATLRVRLEVLRDGRTESIEWDLPVSAEERDPAGEIPDFEATVARAPVAEVYDGDLRGDPWYAEFIRRIEAARSDAIRLAWERLGLQLPEERKIRIEVTEYAHRRNSWASTYYLETPVTVRVSVVRHRRNIHGTPDPAFGLDRVTETVRHEAIHALQGGTMGSDAILALPKWLREGVATYGADQIAVKARTYYAGRDLHDMLDGLDRDERHTLGDYAEDAMAFQYVEDHFGAEAVRRLVRRITYDLVPYRDAFREETGLEFEAFERAVREHGLREFPRILERQGRWADR